MKIDWNHYWHPTPKRMRMFGDALLACGSMVAGGTLIEFDQLKEIFSENELKWIVGVSLILGVVGKFFSNFFKADENQAI